MYNAHTGVMLKKFNMSSAYVALSPDGTRLLTVEGPAANSSGHDYKPVLRGERALARLLRLDSRLVTPGDICLWDVATGSKLMRIPNRSLLEGAAFSPDGSRFAVASSTSVQIFDTATGVSIHEDDPFGDPLLCFAFRRDGALVTVTDHNSVAVVTEYIERGM